MLQHKTLETGGYTWSYTVADAAETGAGAGDEGLLFLGGALSGGEAVITRLAEVARGRRVVQAYYPPVATVAELLAGIDAILEAERLERVPVYGGSFGGIVAQCLVRHRPQRFSHLILSGTGVPARERAARNQRWLARVGWLPVGLMRGILRLLVKGILRRVQTDKELYRQALREQIDRLTRADFVSLYRIAIDFDESWTFTPDDLAAWPGKVLILEGSGDRIAGEAVRAAVRALYPQAQVHTFQGVGHAAPLVSPEEWRRVVLEFLQ